MDTITPEFKDELEKLTRLSSKINDNNSLKILEMMHAHIDEIKKRFHDCDEHWAIETADLIVLCYELLLMEKKDIGVIFDQCLLRFDIKLGRLANHVD